MTNALCGILRSKGLRCFYAIRATFKLKTLLLLSLPILGEECITCHSGTNRYLTHENVEQCLSMGSKQSLCQDHLGCLFNELCRRVRSTLHPENQRSRHCRSEPSGRKAAGPRGSRLPVFHFSVGFLFIAAGDPCHSCSSFHFKVLTWGGKKPLS